MIRKKDGLISIECDVYKCEASDEFPYIRDIHLLKDILKESEWHLKAHKKCICSDCWEAGIHGV
jgi:hypothetical protein